MCCVNVTCKIFLSWFIWWSFSYVKFITYPSKSLRHILSLIRPLTTSLRSYPKVAPEIKSSTILKHANNWGFCAKNSRLAHHFFVYLFNFFLSFLKVAPEEKKLLGAKAKVAPEKSGKSGPKRKQEWRTRQVGWLEVLLLNP